MQLEKSFWNEINVIYQSSKPEIIARMVTPFHMPLSTDPSFFGTLIEDGLLGIVRFPVDEPCEVIVEEATVVMVDGGVVTPV